MEFKFDIKVNKKIKYKYKDKEYNSLEEMPDDVKKIFEAIPKEKLPEINLQDALKDTGFKTVVKTVSGNAVKSQIINEPAADYSYLKSLNNISIFITIWTVIFPAPYRLAILLCSVMPLAAVFIFTSAKGAVRLEPSGTNKNAPHITYMLFGPSISLACRALFDIRILETKNLWPPLISLFIILVFLICYSACDIKVKYWTYILMLPFLFAYCYGVITEANWLLDNSKPDVYNVKVKNKYKNNSEYGYSYYLTISPWAIKTTGVNKILYSVDVNKTLYGRVNIDDDLLIELRNGCLKIPYYNIKKKQNGNKYGTS